MNPDFDRIKKSTDIVRVVESYGIGLKREGKDFVGLCPFHEDKTPSLRVTAWRGVSPAYCSILWNQMIFKTKSDKTRD